MKKDFDEKKEIIKNLRPIDDAFFEKLMEDAAVCQEVVQTITEDTGLKVIKVVPQNSIKNLQGRSVRLDVLCERADGSFCNVEVQKADDDDHVRRVRYNASCITTNIADPGTKFEKVPDVCMIYISRFDIFGAGRTIYHVEPTISENGEKVENGLHEIYVNTKIDDGSNIAELMKCFELADAANEKFPNFSKRVGYFKKEKGEQKMCKSIEDYANKVAEKAAKKAAEKAAKKAEKKAVEEARKEIMETARRMLKNGKLTLEEIAECVPSLKLSEIKALQKEMQDKGIVE